MQGLVEINFLEIDETEKEKRLIEEVYKKCFDEENLNDLNFYVSVTLTTPTEIRKLNNTYRNIDKETDVLSFPMFEKNEIDEIVKNRIKNIVPEVLGDIVVSVDRVKEQAVEYGHSYERELCYMLVHGFYHIMGYDHMVEEDKKIMRSKEEIVLEKLNQTRN